MYIHFIDDKYIFGVNIYIYMTLRASFYMYSRFYKSNLKQYIYAVKMKTECENQGPVSISKKRSFRKIS